MYNDDEKYVSMRSPVKENIMLLENSYLLYLSFCIVGIVDATPNENIMAPNIKKNWSSSNSCLL